MCGICTILVLKFYQISSANATYVLDVIIESFLCCLLL